MIIKSIIVIYFISLFSLNEAYAAKNMTNTHTITIVYTGNIVTTRYEHGQFIYQEPGPGSSVGTVSCGIASQEDSYKTYSVPSNSKQVVIPAGDLKAAKSKYAVLDIVGKFVIQRDGAVKTEEGSTISCRCFFPGGAGNVGQAGILGDFSAEKLANITIGQGPQDNKFTYSDK